MYLTAQIHVGNRISLRLKTFVSYCVLRSSWKATT